MYKSMLPVPTTDVIQAFHSPLPRKHRQALDRAHLAWQTDMMVAAPRTLALRGDLARLWKAWHIVVAHALRVSGWVGLAM